MGGAVSQTPMGDDADLSRASTALADAVRQRLVQIASDVLTGLPADAGSPSAEAGMIYGALYRALGPLYGLR